MVSTFGLMDAQAGGAEKGKSSREAGLVGTTGNVIILKCFLVLIKSFCRCLECRRQAGLDDGSGNCHPLKDVGSLSTKKITKG